MKQFIKAAAIALIAGSASAGEVNLPNTVVTTAYSTGGVGYNQMVAVGSVLKEKYGVNFRVLPGKNDVSRLGPLKAGKAHFASTGSDAVYSQEGVFTFGKEEWGPQPVRLVLLSRPGGCLMFTTATDVGIEKIEDVKGKRVAWVRGSAALQTATKAYLSFAGLTVDDVELVEVGGFAASIEAIIGGDADVAINQSTSTFNIKQEASPRGVFHPEIPHDNEEGWKRLRTMVPWYVPGVCNHEGAPGIPKEGWQGVAQVFPVQITRPDVDEEIVYGFTKAMIDNFDSYKDTVPGMNGWALDKQMEDFYLPYHEGSVKYLKEIGWWSDKAEANQKAMLARQDVLLKAWEDYKASPAEDFKEGWIKARADALTAAGMDPVFTAW